MPNYLQFCFLKLSKLSIPVNKRANNKMRRKVANTAKTIAKITSKQYAKNNRNIMPNNPPEFKKSP